MTAEFEERYIKARKAVIAREFSHLNPTQRDAVMTTEGPLLILAGAGSGKTTVLINRIANLLKYGRGSDSEFVPEGATEEDIAVMEAEPESQRARQLAALDTCEPWRIIAITFTNKAADELRSRLEAMLGPEANDIWAMTFHSACVRILRRDAERLGYPKSFTIYDTSDCQSLVKRIIKEMNLDEKIYQYKTAIGYISRAKDAQQTPEMFAAAAQKSSDPRMRKFAQIYAEYSKRLFDSGAMDFDDLIYLTVRLLSENEDIRDFYRNKFKYLLIDEYQDTNQLQYRLASLLCNSRENICVVGDDDQSIYKFRGATIENILSFEQQFDSARVIKLEQNYRSTGHILSAANSVIRNNVGRKGKELWTSAGDGDLLTLYIAGNENEEAQYVAGKILEHYSSGGNWRDNAILYRMNAQSNQLEYAFKRNGIPYRIFGGTRFFDRAEIKDVTAYMNVVMSPLDDVRLMRIVNTPARGISAATVEKLRAIAESEGLSVFEVMLRADNYPELARVSIKLRQFTIMITELQSLSQTVPLDQFYDILLEKTGYLAALQVKQTDENLARVENVNELKTNILSYIQQSGDSSLSGFMDEIALYTDLDNYDHDADCVVMMTMHAAKGLEFPNVFIVGAEEGIFPSTRAIGEMEEMEEERRLCYVALTRAKKKLYLTCARRRMLFGKTSANKPSRFIDEIPDSDIDKPAAQPRERSSAYGSSYSSGGYSRTGGSYSVRRDSAPTAPSRRVSAPASRAATPAASSAPAPDYSVGDRINHKAFGIGVIRSMKAMGGDHLVEIEFEKHGLKRFMLRAASQSMTKENS